VHCCIPLLGRQFHRSSPRGLPPMILTFKQPPLVEGLACPSASAALCLPASFSLSCHNCCCACLPVAATCPRLLLPLGGDLCHHAPHCAAPLPLPPCPHAHRTPAPHRHPAPRPPRALHLLDRTDGRLHRAHTACFLSLAGRLSSFTAGAHRHGADKRPSSAASFLSNALAYTVALRHSAGMARARARASPARTAAAHGTHHTPALPPRAAPPATPPATCLPRRCRTARLPRLCACRARLYCLPATTCHRAPPPRCRLASCLPSCSLHT